MSDLIVGIDLGTTNSEVATFVDDHVQVLSFGKNNMLPSVVGLSPSGELLVGEPARNQLALYPERTVRSIKRKMGSNETVMLGDRQFTPPEISALLLRELAAWAFTVASLCSSRDAPCRPRKSRWEFIANFSNC